MFREYIRRIYNGKNRYKTINNVKSGTGCYGILRRYGKLKYCYDAWAGTVNSEPPLVSVSIRKSRLSHEIISRTGEFVINLVNNKTVKACDFCGVKSGRDFDKFKETKLTKIKADLIDAPMIEECPVNMECKVKKVLELGSHDMFIAEILKIHVDDSLMDEKGAIDFSKANLVAYSHGEYYDLGKFEGFFGYSIAGEDALKRRMKK